MSNHLILYATMLVLILSPIVMAQSNDLPSREQNEQTQQQNSRFISAEVQRTIQSEMDELEQNVKNYQDENFIALDNRLNQFLLDARTKIIVGGIGAIMVANAIVALVLMKQMRRFSYEAFLESQLDGAQALERDFNQAAPVDKYSDGFGEMVEEDWYPHQPKTTMGQVYGQDKASEMTAMNEWQTQPAYAGSWQSPIEAKPEYTNYPEESSEEDWRPPFEDDYPPFEEEKIDDPFQSPGWSPK